ncbi:MAG: hypothetical protein QXM92_03930 [Candidatus Anstonellales archaeon]
MGLDAGVLTLAAIIAVIAFIVFVNGVLIPEAGNWFLDAVVKMPKFDYRYQGGEQGNENWQMYRNLRTVSFIIIAIALTWSAVILMGEEFEVYRKGEAFSTLAKGLLTIVLIFTFPAIWDLLASGMEGLAKYVLNPSNPNNANQKVSTLMQYIGGITPPDVNWLDILQFLTDPNSSLQTLFRDVFMGVFKAFLAAMLVVLMFIIGTVRIVLTGVLAIALPLVLALSLVPYFDRVMGRLKDMLIGLTVAPVLSALAVSAGLALINSTNFSPLQEWFAAVSVAFLAIMFPVIVAPVLGSLVSSLTTVATGGMLAGLYFAGQGVMGAARGGIGAVQALQQAGVAFNPITYARAAVSGAGRGFMSGLSAGTMRGVGEALTTTGFGRLAEPVMRVERRFESATAKAGLGTANEIIANYTGHVTEGLLPSLTLQDYDSSTLQQNEKKAVAFANEIQQLAAQGRYADIADRANEFLKFKRIGNKEAFGQAFAEQIQAYSKSNEAMTRLYTGLEDIRSKGGVQRLNADQLAELMLARDSMRSIAGKEYGIEIPDSQFEISSYVQLPKALEATTPHLYEANYSLSNAIQEAVRNPDPAIFEGAGQGALQKAIRRTVEKDFASKGIDTEKSAHIIDEFAYTAARKISEQYKDRPKVIATLIRDLNTNYKLDLKNVEKPLLTATDIHSIYEKHKDHAEDFVAFFEYAEKIKNNNNRYKQI